MNREHSLTVGTLESRRLLGGIALEIPEVCLGQPSKRATRFRSCNLVQSGNQRLSSSRVSQPLRQIDRCWQKLSRDSRLNGLFEQISRHLGVSGGNTRCGTKPLFGRQIRSGTEGSSMKGCCREVTLRPIEVHQAKQILGCSLFSGDLLRKLDGF